PRSVNGRGFFLRITTSKSSRPAQWAGLLLYSVVVRIAALRLQVAVDPLIGFMLGLLELRRHPDHLRHLVLNLLDREHGLLKAGLVLRVDLRGVIECAFQLLLKLGEEVEELVEDAATGGHAAGAAADGSGGAVAVTTTDAVVLEEVTELLGQI